MKIVKYALIFVSFGVLGTIIAMFFAPDQHKVSHSMIVNQPISMCWDASLNPETLVNWVDDLDTVETILGNYQEEGYSANLVFRNGETKTKALYEIDTSRRYDWVKTHIRLDEKLLLETKYQFLVLDSAKTNVIATTVLKPSGIIFKLMLSGAESGLQEKRKNELENMKKWLENQPTKQAE